MELGFLSSRLSIEEVKNYFVFYGYVPLFDQYKNCDTKLSVLCDKGHQVQISLYKFKIGRRCSICSNKKRAAKQRLSLEDVKKELGPLYEAWRQSNPALIESATKIGTEVLLYGGKGGDCPDCGGSGYLGRIGLFEVLSVTPTIAKLIAERAGVADIENQAIKEGMLTMKQDGYFRALEGVSTIEEVLRVAQDRAD